MSETGIPQTEEEAEQKKQELIEKTKEKRQEDEARHNELLEAVQEGEDFEIEDYEWVSLGGLEIQVKTWFPGDTLDKITGVAELEGEDDPTAPRKGIQATLEAFNNLTEQVGRDDPATDDAEIRAFWNAYFDKWGDQGLSEAIEVVAGPAIDNSEEEEVTRSFRGSSR